MTSKMVSGLANLSLRKNNKIDGKTFRYIQDGFDLDLSYIL
jgi:hypothetical protein